MHIVKPRTKYEYIYILKTPEESRIKVEKASLKVQDEVVLVTSVNGQIRFNAPLADVSTGRPYNPVESSETSLTYFISSKTDTLFFSLIEPRYRFKLLATILLPLVIFFVMSWIFFGLPSSSGMITFLGAAVIVTIFAMLRKKESAVLKNNTEAQVLKLSSATISNSIRDPYSDKELAIHKKATSFTAWFFFPLYWFVAWALLSIAVVVIGGDNLTENDRKIGMVVVALLSIPIAIYTVKRIARSKIMREVGGNLDSGSK